jgi:phage FluMu protein gp41
MITVTGKLTHGIKVGDVAHKDFEVRAATIGDSVDAIEEAGADASFIRVKVHKIARCLVRVGDLKEGEITADMLLALPEVDFNPLDAALDEAEKKLTGSAKP